MSSRRLQGAIRALASLGEPQRWRLYEFVINSSTPVSRDEAAEALELKRGVASFHLDKLVEEGLLEAEFRRLNDRAGPGAGRPAKLYRRSLQEIEASTPERRYETAGQLFADAIQESMDADISVGECLHRASEVFGAELAAQLQQGDEPITIERVCDLLEEHGYQPAFEGDDIVLRNCPFHHLAQRHTQLVCSMNLAIFEALDDATADVDLDPRLQPEPGCCCVKLEPRK